MQLRRRWVWIVLDSVGIGAAKDAWRYGEADAQSNTLAHIAEAVSGLNVPNLAQLGLGCIGPILGVPCGQPRGAFGHMVETSFGKDTTNGHWEFVGVSLNQPLPVYPDGFPLTIMRPFEAFVGQTALCNRPASGTEVIAQYGPLHQASGQPIVYTSADSVFQVAAHEDTVPLGTLYDWCRYARSLLQGPHGVGRVIARPFRGSPGHYLRTDGRRDYSLNFGHTVLNTLVEAGVPVTGIGKISDIYGGSGITHSVHTSDNEDGMRQVMAMMETQATGLIYANLVDFDAKYGHRNDPIGFARAVERFDQQLGELLGGLTRTDTLLITADHGCDPTVAGTDHTREHVPLLVYRVGMSGPVALGERKTFADIGATLAADFGVLAPPIGESFLRNLTSD